MSRQRFSCTHHEKSAAALALRPHMMPHDGGGSTLASPLSSVLQYPSLPRAKGVMPTRQRDSWCLARCRHNCSTVFRLNCSSLVPSLSAAGVTYVRETCGPCWARSSRRVLLMSSSRGSRWGTFEAQMWVCSATMSKLHAI